MDNKFGADIITLTDDEGNEYEFEHIDTIELNSKMYLAFTEADASDDDENVSEIIILRLDKDENGEEVLSTVDDEAELEAAYEAFMEEALEEDEE
ncbi:MAG: DUF1292 domain-containing protein [Oscillospiraceae bacterium]|nr:DUF1292 domain-containing protein [Oscillospiraceae bacterium]